jgi:hypothetical protein
MPDPTIICPACGTEIKLTESLAAPLVATTRAAYEKQLAAKDAAAAAKEKEIRAREESLKRAQETIDQQLADRLRAERTQIAAEEARKARLAAAADLEQKNGELAALQNTLADKNAKLAAAQKAQAALLVKERELEDARREMDLTVQKQVQAELAQVRQKAQVEAAEQAKLKEAAAELRLAEREQTIAGMAKTIEDLKRKAEQGSQQLQGEVQELALEALLREKFPLDAIEPVPKGEFGGDVTQRVHTPAGQPAGTILWESKRTKNWSDAWLPKLRDDQRAAKAHLAILISAVLPKGVETFGEIDGIWVADPRHALPLALVLRQSLLELAHARQATEGQATKMQLVYQYLTGPAFRQRVQTIVEKFTDMSEDLDRERKAMTKLWAKREQQIHGVIEATAGMYGDLQGIAGRSLKEIEGLEFKVLSEGNCGGST